MPTTALTVDDKFLIGMVAGRERVDKLLKEIMRIVAPLTGVGSKEMRWAIDYCMFSEAPHMPKRIRPLLVLMVMKALGSPISKVHEIMAGIVEFPHIASLVHDDLPSVDDAGLRHGKTVLHKVFPEEFPNIQCGCVERTAHDSKCSGVGLAVHVGAGLPYDLFTILCDPHLLKGVSAIKKLKVAHEIGMALGNNGVMLGQVADLSTVSCNRSVEDILSIHAHKTGGFIRACVRIGGILGNANKRQLLELSRFGELLGLIYQLRDDILDVTSTEAQSGKSTQLDVANKQITYASLIGVPETKIEISKLLTQALRHLKNVHLKHPRQLISLVTWAANRSK